MEFRKNDILTLDIEDCGVDGEGIGKADGFTVFVKDAVIGDRIKAKPFFFAFICVENFCQCLHPCICIVCQIQGNCLRKCRFLGRTVQKFSTQTKAKKNGLVSTGFLSPILEEQEIFNTWNSVKTIYSL